MLSLIAAAALGPTVFRLWTGGAPGALGTGDDDVPTLTLYKADSPCGTAIVVCPGGGYGGLADHEGSGYALYLNRLGITAGVLKYRLGSHGYRHPCMIEDAERALRLMRTLASEWKLDTHKVGVMGSSAGGHLASTLLIHFHAGNPTAKDPIERESSRPDFGVLCYPVIDMGQWTHAGSRENLLGKNPSQALIDELSNQKHVTAETPPCFIWTTADDAVVPAQNSTLFADALVAAKVPVELHVYPHGSHGLGLGGDPASDNLLPWIGEMKRWLGENGWLRPANR